LQQTRQDFEIIVIDDASTDGTQEMLSSRADGGSSVPIRIIKNDQQKGANPSRNAGIRIARGEFIAFLDSDCIAEPDWLEKLLGGFTSGNVAAVTGCVNDPPPANIFEMTFKGTNRLDNAGPAHRLVAGNMCIRRSVLERYPLDEDRAGPSVDREGRPDTRVSGRGDEEGLFLMMKHAGYSMLVVPEAVVLHEHPLSGSAFFRQAFRGGRSAARLVYKYYLPQRIDMLPFLLAYATLPLALLHRYALIISGLFLAAALAAIVYNDLFRKRKSIWETTVSFPVLLVYYHVRLVGYVLESLRLRLTRDDQERIDLSKARHDQTIQD
jgi:glycosyltransferase involved in cell wall biosynthesis